jgi:hypothetical protein
MGTRKENNNGNVKIEQRRKTIREVARKEMGTKETRKRSDNWRIHI